MNPSMIRPFHVERDLASCSRMLSTSEPWMTLGIDESEAARILQLPHHHNHVAVSHKDEPLGLLSLYLEGTFNGYIKLLCVAESARGQGLGAQLLRFAEDTIFPHSPNVFLCVSSFNTAAQRFYEKQGYSLVGELKDFLVQGHGELLMRKTKGPIRGYRV